MCIRDSIYVRWKARKSTFPFHTSTLKRGSDHNSDQAKSSKLYYFWEKKQKSPFILFFVQEHFFLHHMLCAGFQPTLQTRFLGFHSGFTKSQNQNFLFFVKNKILDFCLVTIMVPASLQGAGMKRKSWFSGFSANVDVVLKKS